MYYCTSLCSYFFSINVTFSKSIYFFSTSQPTSSLDESLSLLVIVELTFLDSTSKLLTQSDDRLGDQHALIT